MRCCLDTKTQEIMFSSGKDSWETPDTLFKRYDDVYHFVLDAAADGVNHKCDLWFGPDSPVGVVDALVVEWLDYLKKGNIWLNPPYSRGLQKKFVEKAAHEKCELMFRNDPDPFSVLDVPSSLNSVVCLLPARTDTKLFHEIIKPYASSVEFLKGRVKFVGAKAGAPFPSMVVVF